MNAITSFSACELIWKAGARVFDRDLGLRFELFIFVKGREGSTSLESSGSIHSRDPKGSFSNPCTRRAIHILHLAITRNLPRKCGLVELRSWFYSIGHCYHSALAFRSAEQAPKGPTGSSLEPLECACLLFQAWRRESRRLVGEILNAGRRC